ncbi:MAG: response regulator [Cyclobacteriaceae bacterium]
MNPNKQVTILYVDDEEMNLFIFKKAFEKYYHVITATSGHEGLEKLKEYHNDIIVVISDMRMPQMNGVEFITKAREEFSNIVYFILTGFSYDEHIYQALNDNLIHEFFTKPFDTNKIRNAIDNAIEKLDADEST